MNALLSLKPQVLAALRTLADARVTVEVSPCLIHGVFVPPVLTETPDAWRAQVCCAGASKDPSIGATLVGAMFRAIVDAPNNPGVNDSARRACAECAKSIDLTF